MTAILTQASPGPWTTEADRFEMHILGADYVGGSNTIASVYARSNGPDASEVQAANARLIASAPELLAALKECALQIAQNHGRSLTADEQIALDNARAAIAKAEAN